MQFVIAIIAISLSLDYLSHQDTLELGTSIDQKSHLFYIKTKAQLWQVLH